MQRSWQVSDADPRLTALQAATLLAALVVIPPVFLVAALAVVDAPSLLVLLVALAGGAAWLAPLIHPLRMGTSSDVRRALRLVRVEHPRLFQVVDEIAAALGLEAPHVLYVNLEVNAFALRAAGKDAVMIGMPILALDLVHSFKSTLGHELGHHKAGDLDDAHHRAHNALGALATAPKFDRHPLVRAASRLYVWSALDTRARSRRAEHRADQWGAFVAGRGATEQSLRDMAKIDLLWAYTLDDMKHVIAAGRAPRNVFTLLRAAWEDAERGGEFKDVERWIDASSTSATDTHPATPIRGRIADQALARVPGVVREVGLARELLKDAEQVEVEMTRRLVEDLNNGQQLALLDDKDAALTAMRLSELRVRDEVAALAGPAAQDLSLGNLLQMIYDMRDGTKKGTPWFATLKLGRSERMVQLRDFDLSAEQAAEWIIALLDAAIAKGILKGKVGFGVIRRVHVGGHEWYTRPLARDLARPRGPWEALLSTVDAWEKKNGAR